MAKKVLTINANDTIEDAARLMADSKVGGLPVLRGDKIVGMITETDLFNIFLEMLGARVPGVRVTVLVPDLPGKLHEMTGVITSLGGNIAGMAAVQGEYTGTTAVTIKVSGVVLGALKEALLPVVDKILDIREEKGA